MNKKKSSLLSALLMLCGLAPAQELSPGVEYYTLANGLKVFLNYKPTVPLVHAALAVGLGVKDEDDASSGLVHLLEHVILFGSSESRSGERKIEEIRKLGGYFNAHTDHDLMTMELTLPAGEAASLPQWIHEFVFAVKFVPEEMDGEKKIILQEIGQIRDNPDTFSTDLVLQNLFASHPYSRPIYGRPEIITLATADKLRSLHQAYVVPGNCALAVVGRFDLVAMKRKIEEAFSALKGVPAPAAAIVPAAAPGKKVELKREMDIEQAHLKIGFLAPHFNHPDRIAMSIMTHLLAQGRRPLLHQALSGQRDIVQDIDVRFLSLRYGGAVLIHVTAMRGNLKRIKSDLISFLSRASSLNYGREDFMPDEQRFVTDYLQAGKNILLLAGEDFKEEGGRLAVSYATFLLLNDRPLAEAFADKVDRIKSGDLRSVCGRFFGGKSYVLVEIAPLAKSKEDEKKNR